MSSWNPFCFTYYLTFLSLLWSCEKLCCVFVLVFPCRHTCQLSSFLFLWLSLSWTGLPVRTVLPTPQAGAQKCNYNPSGSRRQLAVQLHWKLRLQVQLCITKRMRCPRAKSEGRKVDSGTCSGILKSPDILGGLVALSPGSRTKCYSFQFDYKETSLLKWAHFMRLQFNMFAWRHTERKRNRVVYAGVCNLSLAKQPDDWMLVSGVGYFSTCTIRPLGRRFELGEWAYWFRQGHS